MRGLLIAVLGLAGLTVGAAAQERVVAPSYPVPGSTAVAQRAPVNGSGREAYYAGDVVHAGTAYPRGGYEPRPYPRRGDGVTGADDRRAPPPPPSHGYGAGYPPPDAYGAAYPPPPPLPYGGGYVTPPPQTYTAPAGGSRMVFVGPGAATVTAAGQLTVTTTITE